MRQTWITLGGVLVALSVAFVGAGFVLCRRRYEELALTLRECTEKAQDAERNRQKSTTTRLGD